MGQVLSVDGSLDTGVFFFSILVICRKFCLAFIIVGCQSIARRTLIPSLQSEIIPMKAISRHLFFDLFGAASASCASVHGPPFRGCGCGSPAVDRHFKPSEPINSRSALLLPTATAGVSISALGFPTTDEHIKPHSRPRKQISI
jgi:hypothetical protein